MAMKKKVEVVIAPETNEGKVEKKAKTIEKKTEAKKIAEPKKVSEKTPVKKAAPKKTETAKKVPAEKKKKEAVKESFTIQYMGKEAGKDEIMTRIHKSWTEEFGKKASDMKSLDLYIKMDEGIVYYVINDDFPGKIEI